MRLALLDLWLFVLPATINAADYVPYPQQKPIEADTKSVFDADFDAFVDKTLHQWHIPGLSIAVIDHGEITSKVAIIHPNH